MRSRPWPIVILAILYILGPLFNTLAGAWLVMRVPYGQYMHALFKVSSAWGLIKLFALYPLAGLAIYAVKEWSYPVFLIVMGYAIFSNFQDFHHHGAIFKWYVLVGTVVLNAGIVGYFLIPAVRVAYFNRRLRWWESKPRYEVRLHGRIEAADNEVMRCSILNLSEGGAFVKTSKPLSEKSVVRVHFMVLSRTVDVSAKVVFCRQADRVVGYGMEFQHTDETEAALKHISRALLLIGLRPRLVNPSWRESLKLWFTTLVTTGKGLIPEIPSYVAQAKAENPKGLARVFQFIGISPKFAERVKRD